MPPFTGPNVISDGNVTYPLPGGVTTPGSTGQYVTVDAADQGSGVVWGVADLVNAPSGVLAVMFDINFLEPFAEADSQSLLRNLISFVDAETTKLPEPGSLLLLGAGLGVLAGVRRRSCRCTA